MNEVSGCSLYPGPDKRHGVQQDRLRKCSLTLVESAQADTPHAKQEENDSCRPRAKSMSELCLLLTGVSLRIS